MRSVHIVAAGLALLLGSAEVRAQEPADTAVTVIVPIDVEAGVTEAQAVAAMKEIAGFIHTRPGLLAEQMMVSDYAGTPKYLHFMRWQSLSNWMDLNASEAFQTILSKDLPYVKIQLAQPYRSVP